MTLKLGIIGTNWITKMFVEAAHQTGRYELTHVYSRNAEKGAAFAADLGATVDVFTDLDLFYASGVDVVYIASPNSLHFAQAKAAIMHDVSIIVEKSIFSNPTEFEMIYDLLQRHPKVRMFEAARHIYQPTFKAIEKQVQAMPVISGGTFVYEKYSSRFDAYLAGEEPNVLTREFSAGALTDLGVYPIYAIVKLFGLPTESHYYPTLLRNGADGRGTAILQYPDFNMVAEFGKMSNSYQDTEIRGRKDTLIVDSIAELDGAVYIDESGERHDIAQPGQDNPMVVEAEVFADMLEKRTETETEYNELLMLSQRVNLVLTALRQSAGIVFPADK
jgi:predicted dehydrogenase